MKQLLSQFVYYYGIVSHENEIPKFILTRIKNDESEPRWAFINEDYPLALFLVRI